MTTLAHPVRPSKASRILSIRGIPYTVEAVDPGEDGTAAFFLTKQLPDAEPYYIVRTHAGRVECSCADYVARRRGTAGTCKHGAALVAARLLDAPRPVPNVSRPSRPGIDRVRDEFDEPAPITPIDAIRQAQADAFGIRLPATPAKAIIAPDAEDGEGHGEPGEDLGPADPSDEWDDDDDRLTLAEFIEITRDAYRAIDSGAADLITEALDDLLAECRTLGNPATAQQFRDRRDAMTFDHFEAD